MTKVISFYINHSESTRSDVWQLVLCLSMPLMSKLIPLSLYEQTPHTWKRTLSRVAFLNVVLIAPCNPLMLKHTHTLKLATNEQGGSHATFPWINCNLEFQHRETGICQYWVRLLTSLTQCCLHQWSPNSIPTLATLDMSGDLLPRLLYTVFFAPWDAPFPS